MTGDRACYLYRHFDAKGVLLYVGISFSALMRLQGHKKNSSWFSEISTVTLERFYNRQGALAAERKAIAEERPRYNGMRSAKNQLHFTVTPEQLQRIKDMAALRALSVNSFILACLGEQLAQCAAQKRGLPGAF